MFKVNRLLWLMLLASAWTTTSLNAQTTYEVDLAGITIVNRNLDVNCQSQIIYLNLLAGDFDVDGDGIAPPESAFNIQIDDADPSNGSILDGCGTFAYSVTPADGGGLVGFISASGFINASDVTAPSQFGVAEPNGPFFTTQFNDITINTLPQTVSRTFVVDGETSFPLMNSLDPALMMRLLAGGDIPRFMDGCSDVEVTVADAVMLNGDCGDIVITRSFTARDFSSDCNPEEEGNTETVVSYDIVLQRPSGLSVQAPPAVADFECTDPDLVDGEFPDPNLTDYPFIDTPEGRVFLSGTYGNIGVSFSDSEAVVTCDDTYKFVRTYTVIDWCDPENVRTFTQLVKVGDTNPPTISGPQQDLNFDGVPDDGPLVFSTNAPGCGAFIPTNTGGLLIADGCGEVATVTAFVMMDGDEDDMVGPIDVMAINPTERLTPFLPAGPHTLRYVATDACGNESTLDIEILIEDRSGPVVIIEDALNIALSSSGFAEVPASDLDVGSYDDCTDITVEIAFANPSSMLAIGSFGPSITLTCIDVGAVPVIIRVTDENGNSNQQMAILNVVDNSAPLCIAPGGMTIDCTEADDLLPDDVNVFFATDPVGTINLLNNLFGQPTSLDNCGNELVTQTVVSTINDCGQGTLTRSFTVTDARGFVSAPGCNQLITIGGMRDYTIVWPADAEATCGEIPTYEDVGAQEFGCDLIVSTMQTDTFFAAAEECFKLRRTIEVLNWCEYNGIDDPYTIPRDADGDGDFFEPTYLHVIPGNNANPNDDRAVLDMDDNRNNGFIRPLDIDDNFPIEVDTDNDGDTGFANSLSRGYYRYVQFIKVYDTQAPNITNISSSVVPGTNCEGGDVTISYAVLDDCVQTNVSSLADIDFDYVATNGFFIDRVVTDAELSGNGAVGFNIDLEDVPAGQHAVRVRGLDGCGNTDGRIIPFTVEAGGSISPICIGELTFVLMPDGEGGGMAMVEADDFVIDVSGGCGGEDYQYSIYREETETGVPGFVPAPGRAELPATCEDQGDLEVRVFTFGPNGSVESCLVTAIIQPFNDNVCGDGGLGSLAGFITSPFNDLLSDIEIHITETSGDMEEMQYTDENGSFLFPGLNEGNEYMIRPAMGDMVNLQRVKTSDVNRIMSHIMGINPITNPYLLVAADVDANGMISIGDMVAIRRVILGLDNTFANSPTYRFIQRDFSLDGLAEGWDPEMFPSTFTVEQLLGHNREADFVAVEIGDVFIQETGREARSLLADDEQLAAGQRYELTLTAGELSGFQGTIEAASGLRIVDWSSNLLGAGNVNDALLSRGLLAVSFDERETLAGQEIITLELVAERDLRISEYLSVTNRLTATEAITPAGASAALDLAFRETPGGAGITLHQNFPNPVAAQTTIKFDLPTAQRVTLLVHDVQGRLLHERTIAATAGSNTLDLTTNDLKNTTGVLTYTLAVGQHRLTKRMTVIAR